MINSTILENSQNSIAFASERRLQFTGKGYSLLYIVTGNRVSDIK